MTARESQLVGGHPVLDLVNTVGWRHEPARTVDRLPDFAAVTRWAVAASVLDDDTARLLNSVDPATAERATRQVVRLRERLYPVLTALAQRRTPNRDALTRVHDDLVRAMRRAEPGAELPLRSTVTVRQPDDLTDLLALLAGELLRSTELERIGQCADDSCGWLFLDRTRSHTRRWCSSADCGNRDRARRHYTRRHPGPAGAEPSVI